MTPENTQLLITSGSTLLATLIGGCLGWAASYYTAKEQAREDTERMKFQISNEKEMAQDARMFDSRKESYTKLLEMTTKRSVFRRRHQPMLQSEEDGMEFNALMAEVTLLSSDDMVDEIQKLLSLFAKPIPVEEKALEEDLLNIGSETQKTIVKMRKELKTGERFLKKEVIVTAAEDSKTK